MLAAQMLNELGPFESEAKAKKNVTQAIKDVAKQLGNRPATCRKYYVHPAIIDAYMDGLLFQIMQQRTKQNTNDSSPALSAEERAVLKLLEQHLVKDSQNNPEN